MTIEVYSMCKANECAYHCCSFNQCGDWYQCSIDYMLVSIIGGGIVLSLIILAITRQQFIYRLISEVRIPNTLISSSKIDAHLTKVTDLTVSTDHNISNARMKMNDNNEINDYHYTKSRNNADNLNSTGNTTEKSTTITITRVDPKKSIIKPTIKVPTDEVIKSTVHRESQLVDYHDFVEHIEYHKSTAPSQSNENIDAVHNIILPPISPLGLPSNEQVDGISDDDIYGSLPPEIRNSRIVVPTRSTINIKSALK